MKKLFVALFVIFSCQQVQAQVQQPSFTLYGEATLMSMSKLKLSEIYLQQVDILAQAVPYSAFTLQTGTPADSMRTSLDIPQSKYIKSKRDDIQKTSIEYGKVMKEKLYEIVPYSDKADIVRAILYLQNINMMVRKPNK